MLDATFSSVYTAADSMASSVSTGEFLLCSVSALVLGAILGCVYMFRHEHSKNFVVTLALLPLIVQMVIVLVNGNLGAGIAVMGVFNLVRFRSVPGSAKDMAAVFLAMAVGLALGMGFIGLAALFTVVVSVANIAYVLSPFARPKGARKALRITVPEDLEFEGVFDEVLSTYASEYELVEVQTSNMGSLFQLEYTLCMKEAGQEKKLIDDIRCLNGNLKVSLAYSSAPKNVL